VLFGAGEAVFFIEATGSLLLEAAAAFKSVCAAQGVAWHAELFPAAALADPISAFPGSR
jgi:hypothetical protein